MSSVPHLPELMSFRDTESESSELIPNSSALLCSHEQAYRVHVKHAKLNRESIPPVSLSSSVYLANTKLLESLKVLEDLRPWGSFQNFVEALRLQPVPDLQGLRRKSILVQAKARRYPFTHD